MPLNSQTIKDLLQKQGPLFPSEVASRLSSTSLITNALLDELSNQGEILKSPSIGSSALYYLQGQEERLREKLGAIKKSPSLSNYGKSSLPSRLSQEQVQKLIQEEAEYKLRRAQQKARIDAQLKYKSEGLPLLGSSSRGEIYQVRKSPQERISQITRPSFSDEELLLNPIAKTRVKRLVAYPKAQIKKDPLQDSRLLKNIISKIEERRIRVDLDSIIKKKGEWWFEAQAPGSLGTFKAVGIINLKNNISDTDLSRLFESAITKKTLHVLFYRGKLSKQAEIKYDDVKGLVRLFEL